MRVFNPHKMKFTLQFPDSRVKFSTWSFYTHVWVCMTSDPSISPGKLKNLGIPRVGGSLSFFIPDLSPSCAIRDSCCAVFCMDCSTERGMTCDKGCINCRRIGWWRSFPRSISQILRAYMHILFAGNCYTVCLSVGFTMGIMDKNFTSREKSFSLSTVKQTNAKYRYHFM